MYLKILVALFIVMTGVSACETDQERNERIAVELQRQSELEKQMVKDEQETAERLKNDQAEKDRVNEVERVETEARMQEERAKQELYDKYIDNSLSTGATPYSRYFGSNPICNNEGCSKIEVTTSNSDVLVTIKNNDEVVRHAFIKAGDRYSFSFPNGRYQAFFYYGKGWSPAKEMKGGLMKGGFISNEDFGKDDPQSLYNNVLRYELIMQQNGNFSTRPSSADEAL